MSFSSLLVDTVTISYRSTTEQDSVGGAKLKWATRHSAIPARINEVSVSDREMAGRQGQAVTHKVFIDAAYTGVTEGDMVTASSVNYDVVQVLQFKNANVLHHFELMVNRYK